MWTQIRTERILVMFGSKPFETLLVILKEFLKKIIFKKVSRQQQQHEKLPAMQRDQRMLQVL